MKFTTSTVFALCSLLSLSNANLDTSHDEVRSLERRALQEGVAYGQRLVARGGLGVPTHQKDSGKARLPGAPQVQRRGGLGVPTHQNDSGKARLPGAPQVQRRGLGVPNRQPPNNKGPNGKGPQQQSGNTGGGNKSQGQQNHGTGFNGNGIPNRGGRGTGTGPS